MSSPTSLKIHDHPPYIQVMYAKPSGKKAGTTSSKTHNHPTYLQMIQSALTENNERKGVGLPTILKYVMTKFDVGQDSKRVNTQLKLALRRGVDSGDLKQVKGTGASGSFKLGEKKVATAKPKAAKSETKKAPVSPKKTMAPSKKKAQKKPVTHRMQTGGKAPPARAVPKPVTHRMQTGGKAPPARAVPKPTGRMQVDGKAPKREVPSKKPTATKKVSKSPAKKAAAKKSPAKKAAAKVSIKSSAKKASTKKSPAKKAAAAGGKKATPKKK